MVALSDLCLPARVCSDENTWEPVDNVSDELIAEFDEKQRQRDLKLAAKQPLPRKMPAPSTSRPELERKRTEAPTKRIVLDNDDDDDDDDDEFQYDPEDDDEAAYEPSCKSSGASSSKPKTTQKATGASFIYGVTARQATKPLKPARQQPPQPSLKPARQQPPQPSLSTGAEPVKRGRGRPKGSKNVPKVDTSRAATPLIASSSVKTSRGEALGKQARAAGERIPNATTAQALPPRKRPHEGEKAKMTSQLPPKAEPKNLGVPLPYVKAVEKKGVPLPYQKTGVPLPKAKVPSAAVQEPLAAGGAPLFEPMALGRSRAKGGFLNSRRDAPSVSACGREGKPSEAIMAARARRNAAAEVDTREEAEAHGEVSVRGAEMQRKQKLPPREAASYEYHLEARESKEVKDRGGDTEEEPEEREVEEEMGPRWKRSGADVKRPRVGTAGDGKYRIKKNVTAAASVPSTDSSVPDAAHWEQPLRAAPEQHGRGMNASMLSDTGGRMIGRQQPQGPAYIGSGFAGSGLAGSGYTASWQDRAPSQHMMGAAPARQGRSFNAYSLGQATFGSDNYNGVPDESVARCGSFTGTSFTGNSCSGNGFTSNCFTGNSVTGNYFTGNSFTGSSFTSQCGGNDEDISPLTPEEIAHGSAGCSGSATCNASAGGGGEGEPGGRSQILNQLTQMFDQQGGGGASAPLLDKLMNLFDKQGGAACGGTTGSSDAPDASNCGSMGMGMCSGMGAGMGSGCGGVGGGMGGGGSCGGAGCGGGYGGGGCGGMGYSGACSGMTGSCCGSGMGGINDGSCPGGTP